MCGAFNTVADVNNETQNDWRAALTATVVAALASIGSFIYLDGPCDLSHTPYLLFISSLWSPKRLQGDPNWWWVLDVLHNLKHARECDHGKTSGDRVVFCLHLCMKGDVSFLTVQRSISATALTNCNLWRNSLVFGKTQGGRQKCLHFKGYIQDANQI